MGQCLASMKILLCSKLWDLFVLAGLYGKPDVDVDFHIQCLPWNFTRRSNEGSSTPGAVVVVDMILFCLHLLNCEDTSGDGFRLVTPHLTMLWRLGTEWPPRLLCKRVHKNFCCWRKAYIQ